MPEPSIETFPIVSHLRARFKIINPCITSPSLGRPSLPNVHANRASNGNNYKCAQRGNSYTGHFFKTRPLRSSKKFTIVRKPATASYATMTWGSCKEYANNIIHGLYRNVNLNFSTVGESSSYAIDWGFCNDSALRNKLGCNYTIVPARYHNGSFRTELHYFVRSFTETSQHLQLGKYYQFDIEKCKDAVVKIRVGADNNSLFSSRTTSGFFFFPTKRRTPEGHERTSHREPSTDNERQRKRNNGIHGVLLDNRVHTLCAATVLAVLKTF